ncbi:TPA: hypothetical protein HA249_06700 [Candidatus Woesearchaeota archaeon]|nr:hypothetical protein [Candidatus Woesearchaeota archaeon]HIH47635.1 hypothetical protein [Candidatus Woesearchaeota archaeon]HII88953.1 hypothetical protein [Candidatus Woesearchaeota archaeon]
MEKQHPVLQWSVSILQLRDNGNRYYKVTRRMYALAVAETKFFLSKEEAQQQFEAWLE